MEPKRADLGGPVKAIREALPQARHHFTQADQVNQLVSASEADPDLGFMARMMTLCSLPRTNPGNRLQYKRVNGPFKLIMIAGGDNKLPFGNLPRLLLAWVCTEAVRTKSRELVLGRSLSEFMRKLDVISSDSGGSWGIRTRLKNQMDRLFSATVSLIYEDDGVKARVSSLVADHSVFWWNPKRPDEPMLWESKIRLGEEFFHVYAESETGAPVGQGPPAAHERERRRNFPCRNPGAGPNGCFGSDPDSGAAGSPLRED